MTELIRAYAVRPPEALSQNDINSFGIHSHPEMYQSNIFKDWLSLCQQTNKKELLTIRVVEYLRGSQSLKNLNGFGKEWAYIFNHFLSTGNQLNKAKAAQIVKASNIEAFLGKEKNNYHSARTTVADTMLGLAYLKKLSFKGNIDYQFVLKTMNFVEDCLKYKFDPPQISIKPYFERPVLLPPCFFKLDPCDTKRMEENIFPFLEDIFTTRPYEMPRASGCVSDGECSCKTNEECVDQNTCCAKIQLNIIDLMLVKEHTKCYQAGDLSYIKNILDGESLETTHRRLERTEEFTETEESITTFEEKYLQTEEKASLKKEIENVIKKDSAWDAGLTTNSSFGIPIGAANLSFGTNSTTNFSGSESKTTTDKDVRDYSKEVVERATKNVEERVRRLASTRRLFETEETNKHSFENTGGANISGQYLYVNKVSKAQVYNYGKKAAVNIYLPEPVYHPLK